MTDDIFCPNCGARLNPRALSCSFCGARLDEFEIDDAEDRPAPTFPTAAVLQAVPVPQAPPEPAPAPEGLVRAGMIAAGIAGAVAAGVVLVAGLLIAIVAPDVSLIGSVGASESLLVETFRQAIGTLLAPMVDLSDSLLAGSRRVHPLILLAIPITALALAVRWQIHRTEGAPPLTRLAWALLVAVPFGVLMLMFALLSYGNDGSVVSPSPGNTFALGVLWGLIGGLIGAATTLPLKELVTVPPGVARVLRAAVATLWPLAAVVAIATVLGVVGWLVQVGADAGGVREGRGTATALIEEAFYAPEHGVQLTALGAGTLFRPDGTGGLGLPFPVDDPNSIPGTDGAFRIFSYGDALPAYVFLPAVVLLLGLNLLAALYAGFAAARAVGADRPGTAAAWGALVGPVWALTMVAAVVLAGGLLHGDAGDGSVFGIYLVGGALLGAGGGALSAAQSGRASASS
ncbi:zinc ribbon domain-containing protein [Solirubrobacter phytolaccae]|uniref:Zinc ribbon domain-containing protein n=1 Tax=Solirubrobacter phytolaccae TaxID=1404360 RepID=A0A9X3NE94_9ACTN|nr:zinc ribbon domain-containing protein [Solirubrobacter phytolaccae]MDA0184471.1 zinc ribbon domain-containing protein [Solirubrobacter phytolaccae]